jgi:hypothetical protein
VRAEGFEPSRSLEHRHLKPACLPFHHARSVAIVPVSPPKNLSAVPDSLGSVVTRGAHTCGLLRTTTPCSASSPPG